MTAGLQRVLGSVGARFALLFLGGLLFVGAGFYVMLVVFTRQWLLQELDFRARASAEHLAGTLSTPLLVRDLRDIDEKAEQAAHGTDVVGVSVLLAGGKVITAKVGEPAYWPDSPPQWGDSAAAELAVVPVGRVGAVSVREVLAPVKRAAPRAHSPLAEASELYGLSAGPAAAPAGSRLLGWVRVVVSTARLERSVARVERVGLGVLLAVLVLGLVALALLLRLVMRPLRDAGELAREIAGGRLDRRMPVRSRDELGALAESMNSMAAGLSEARRRLEGEAAALRTTADIVLAVARSARATQDPEAIFAVVAGQLRALTGCRGVALAIPLEDVPILEFRHFDPPLPWGSLDYGLRLGPEFVQRLGVGDAPARAMLAGAEDSLCRGLAGDEFQSALLVPLPLGDGPQALLLLASDRTDAFAPSQMDVVAGLASHLGAALHAARLSARLEHAIEELESTRDHLVRSEKLRATGEMAAGIAHDFNNVLGAILGRAQLLQRRLAGGALAPKELSAALAVIERAARDGGETVRRLLQFGRGIEATAETVDFDRVLRDAADYTRTRWENEAQSVGRYISLGIDSSPGAWVVARSSELREVVANLIFNAVDALPKGGHVTLGSLVEGTRVVVTVEDDGTGMTADTQRRIFDPFFTTKGERGCGLGLSVAYAIVHRYKGEIEVRSRPGGGTCVRLTFPLAAPPGAEPAPAPVAVQQAGVKLTVMIVDDEAPVRDILRDITLALGHEAVPFESAPAALRGFSPGRYDLVMTDLGMPEVNGWQLASRLRELDPAVTIALVTGWGDTLAQDAVRTGGADTVVSKPFTIEDVAELMQLAAGRKGSRRAA